MANTLLKSEVLNFETGLSASRRLCSEPSALASAEIVVVHTCEFVRLINKQKVLSHLISLISLIKFGHFSRASLIEPAKARHFPTALYSRIGLRKLNA